MKPGFLFVLFCALLAAQDLSEFPAYRPESQVEGTIRLWGHGSPTHAFMRRLAVYWKEGFAQFQPAARIQFQMYGTASSIGALYTGAGDLAIRGEEIHPFEMAAFERVLHYPPFGVDIATGSLDVRNMDFAFVIFVHKDNPLTKLSLTQLDGILGAEHRRGDANIRTWDQLGLKGDFAGKPIHVYSWRLDDDFSSFLEEAVLERSHRWNCAIKEYAHINRSDGSIYDSGQQILDDLATDPYGIAVSNFRYRNRRVKPLALSVKDGAPCYEASRENLIRRTYPLTRIIPAFVNRVPGQPLDPKVKEFLRYILSREGQSDIVRDGGYLPLSKEAVIAQRRKLE